MNSPVELGRRTNARGGEQSTKIEKSVDNEHIFSKPQHIQRRCPMDDLSLYVAGIIACAILYLFQNIVEKRCFEHCVRKWERFWVKYAEWKR